MPYSSMLLAADLITLDSRREDISRLNFSALSQSLPLACTTFYQTQRWNPIILGSDDTKNS